MKTSRPLPFLALAAVSTLLTGCPDHPTCPDCSVKDGKYTVGEYDELDDGYEITGAKLTHTVQFNSHCPSPPSGDRPPCSRSDTTDVMPAQPGESYTKTLLFRTDSNQDSESANVELTLTLSGKPDVTKNVTVTIVE